MAALADTAKLIVALVLDDKLSGPLGRVESGLGRMAKGTGQVAGGLARLGAVAGVAAVGGIGLAAKAAIDFEDAFAGIKKTVDETDLAAAGLTFDDLSDSIRKMAREMPIAATDLARIGEAAGALGIKAQDIDDFTKVVAELSVTTNLTADDAATALGQLGTVLNLTGDDFTELGDSLVALGNKGASTEDQIVAIAARFAAAGSAAGLSKEDILAFASATASMGIEAESAGSSLSRTFNNITTGIGTNSKTAQEFAKALGQSATDFRASWDKDAVGTFEDFLVVLSKLDKFEAADLLKKVGITNVRDIAAVQLMSQNLDDFNSALETSRNATGALSVEAEKKFGTVASQIQKVKNNLTDVGITIGNELLPIIGDLSKEFADFLNTPGAQAGIKGFAQDLAGGVRGLVSELKGTDFSGIIDGMKLAATVAKGAFDAFRSLPAPIQQLAIAALIANKVSGGAIGSIAKGLGNILLGSLKTITAGNVTVIGANVTGGGLGGAPVAAGGSLLTKTLTLGAKFVLGPLAAIAIGKEIAQALNEATIAPAREFEQEQFANVIANATTMSSAQIQDKLEAINSQLNSSDASAQVALIASRIPYIGDALGNVAPELEAQRDKLQALLDQAINFEAAVNIGASKAENLSRTQQAELVRINQSVIAAKAEANAKQAAMLQSLQLQHGSLVTIADKNFSPRVDVTVNSTTNVSVSNISRTLSTFYYAGKISNLESIL